MQLVWRLRPTTARTLLALARCSVVGTPLRPGAPALAPALRRTQRRCARTRAGRALRPPSAATARPLLAAPVTTPRQVRREEDGEEGADERREHEQHAQHEQHEEQQQHEEHEEQQRGARGASEEQQRGEHLR